MPDLMKPIVAWMPYAHNLRLLEKSRVASSLNLKKSKPASKINTLRNSNK